MLPRMNIKYPIFYHTLFLKYCYCPPPLGCYVGRSPIILKWNCNYHQVKSTFPLEFGG